MINITVSGIKELQAELKDFSERRLRAAVATAMTRTAVQVRDRLKADLQTAIQRPTRYTVQQLKYAGATAQRPVAAVGFDILPIQDVYGNVLRYQAESPGTTPAGKYMALQAEGGARRTKRFERALQTVGVLPAGWFVVPGARARVDAYGNQSPGEIRQILSWFDAAELVAGSRQNMGPAGRDRRRKGARRTAGYEYFVIRPGERRGGLVPGIYRRTSFALGKRVEPVMIFVKGAGYRRRFDFYGIAQRQIDATLPRELKIAIQQSAARLAASR